MLYNAFSEPYLLLGSISRSLGSLKCWTIMWNSKSGVKTPMKHSVLLKTLTAVKYKFMVTGSNTILST